MGDIVTDNAMQQATALVRQSIHGLKSLNVQTSYTNQLQFPSWKCFAGSVTVKGRREIRHRYGVALAVCLTAFYSQS